MARTFCNTLDASTWVWDNLWQKDCPKAQFDIVDVIKMNKGDVEGWIFTATDGDIKRRSVSKWSERYIEAKCQDFEGNMKANMLSEEGWSTSSNSSNFQIPPSAKYVLPMTHFSAHQYYVEQVFEKQDGIALPKMGTYILVDSDVKGKRTEVQPQVNACSIPIHSICCKNKKVIETMKRRMLKLIRTLEQRSKSKISNISCVFLVEDTNDGEHRILLHHCKNIVLAATRKVKDKNYEAGSETRSVISEMTNLSRGSCRNIKCAGDFCSFNHAYESSLSEMEDELNFRIDIEAAKAKRRHKNVDGIIEADLDVEVETNVKFQRELVESSISGNPLTDSNACTQAYKVPRKSVLLARSEMKVLDSTETYLPEISAWSRTLQAWYRRTGCALIGQRNTAIPASSGHHIENALLQITEHGAVVDESHLHESNSSAIMHLDHPKLTENALKAHEENSVSPHEVGQCSTEVLFDLASKPFHMGKNTDAKHFGRYYSNASVCEKCYHVYKDLDRLRQSCFKQDLSSKKQIALRAKEDLVAYESIEKVNRFTNQTLHNMRLAQAKVRINKNSAYPSNITEDPSIYFSKKGAPKGALPPLPWQLSKAEVAAEYQKHGGSSFVRNIGDKARHMSALVEQKNINYHQPRLDDADVLNPNYDWKKNLAVHHGLVKSSSAGDTTVGAGRRPKKSNTRGFNSERLLHPHQRQLAALKREQNPHDASLSNSYIKVKGGSKRKMISQERASCKLPPVTAVAGKVKNAVEQSKTAQDSSPLTLSYVQSKLNSPPCASIKSVKSVSFSACNSIRSIPHRNESIREIYEDEDDDSGDNDDGIGWSPFSIENVV